MLQAIKYCLTRLTDFTGRDARQTFWFYALFLAIVHMALSFLITVPFTASVMKEAMVAVQGGKSEAELPQAIFAHALSSLRLVMWGSIALSFALVVLLLAAFTRRLHDSGKPGWIAIVAALIQIVALALSVSTFDRAMEIMTLAQAGNIEAVDKMQGEFFLQSFLGWVPLVLVVVFGLWPPTPGANRYGPAPVL